MRMLVGIIVGVVIGALGLFLYAHFSGHWVSARSAADSAQAGAAYSWPADRAWSWTFPAPPAGTDGDWVGLRIREKSLPTSPTTVAVMPVISSAMTRAEADREFGTGKTGRFAGEAP